MQSRIRSRQDPKHVIRNIFGSTFGNQLVEQISDLLLFQITTASDIYSLGLLIAQILVHKKIEIDPLLSATSMESFISLLRSEIKLQQNQQQQSQSNLISLILRCLDKESSKRPTAEEIQMMINKF